MPESLRWERWRPSPYGEYDDMYAKRWQKDNNDKGHRCVARRGDGQPFDSGRDILSAMINNNSR